MFGVNSHIKIGAVPCGESGGTNISMSKTSKMLLFLTSAVLTNTSCVEGVFNNLDFRAVIEGVENAGKALEKVTKDAGEAVEKMVKKGGEAAKDATEFVEKVGKDLEPHTEELWRKVDECGEGVKKWCDEAVAAGELNLHQEFNCRASLRCVEVNFGLMLENSLVGRGRARAASSSNSPGSVVVDESENMVTVSTPEDQADIHVAAAPESETNPHQNGGSTTPGRDDNGVAAEQVEVGEVVEPRASAPEAVDDTTHHGHVHVIEDEERPDTVDMVDDNHEGELHQVPAPGAGNDRFVPRGTRCNRGEDDTDAAPVAAQLAEESEADAGDQHHVVGTQTTETRHTNEDAAVLTTRSPRSREGGNVAISSAWVCDIVEPGHVGRAAAGVGNSSSAADPEHSAQHVEDAQESAHSGFLARRQSKKPKPDHLANALCFEDDGRAVDAEAEGGEGGCSSSSSPAGVRVKEEQASSSSGPSEQDQSGSTNAGGAAEDHDSSDGVEVIVGEGGRGDGSYHSARGSEAGNGGADSGGSGSGTMDGDAEEEEEEDAGVDDAGDAEGVVAGDVDLDHAEEDEYDYEDMTWGSGCCRS